MSTVVRNRYSRYLAQHADLVGRAQLPGRIYALKRYPCMRPAQNDQDKVSGELHRIRTPERVLAVLDAYEDRDYRRVVRRATLEDGRVVRCWVYEFGRALPRHRRIEAGAWLSDTS